MGGNNLGVALLKIKNTLLGKSKIITAVLVLLLVISGTWMYMEYSKPVYREEQVLTSSYTHTGNYNYSTSVTMENPLYPVGTVLDMGKPAYFFTVSPTVDMSFEYGFDATDTADLTVKRKTMIVATSKGDDGKVFWQKKYPVKHCEPVRIENGDELAHNFSLNVSDIRSRVNNVQKQIGYSQDTKIEVVTDVIYEGTVNGRNVNGIKEYAIPLEISSSYYQMPEKLDFGDTVDSYKTQKVRVEPSVSTVKEPLVSLLFSIGLIVLLGVVRKDGMVDPHYIKKLELENEHSQFADWISNGKLPEMPDSLMEIKIESLADLVDAAADMNERVIYDTDEGIYFVIHSGALYKFSDQWAKETDGSQLNS